MQLRGHHLYQLYYYHEEILYNYIYGYDEEQSSFAKSFLSEIVNNPEKLVQIIDYCDNICSKCKKRELDNVCSDYAVSQDQKIAQSVGLEIGKTHTSKEIIEKVLSNSKLFRPNFLPFF